MLNATQGSPAIVPVLPRRAKICGENSRWAKSCGHANVVALARTDTGQAIPVQARESITVMTVFLRAHPIQPRNNGTLFSWDSVPPGGRHSVPPLLRGRRIHGYRGRRIRWPPKFYDFSRRFPPKCSSILQKDSRGS